MTNLYKKTFDSIEPGEQKKQETIQKLIAYKSGAQAGGKPKTKRHFTWNIRRAIVAVSAAAVLIFCAVFVPIITIKGGGNPPAHSAGRIVILDASASMMARQKNGRTRFKNAIEKTRKLGEETIADKEQITVILAGKEAKTVIKTDSLEEFNRTLDSLECTFGRADIEGATALANDILSQNTDAEIMLYTAQQFESNNIETIDVFENEWNAAILNVAQLFDEETRCYTFEATVASYNKDADLTVYFEARGVNSEFKTVTAQKTVFCKSNNHVVFQFDDLEIYEYDSVRIYIDADDSFEYDNEFYLYDGRKETIKVLYVTSMPSLFFKSTLLAMQHAFKHQWNIEITEGKFGEAELKGYDFYIFEHKMPQKLPTDGLVWLVNPDIAPEGSGLTLEETVNIPNGDSIALSAGQPSPIMEYIAPEKISVVQYRRITSYDGYEVLMYCGDDPALMVKNEPDAKVAVLSFSLHQSNLPLVPDLVVLTFNLFNGLFDYFSPSTITEYVFEVDQQVSVNARGEVLQINNGQGFMQTHNTFPDITVPRAPGSYTLTQTLMSGKIAIDNFFVKITDSQSDFGR